MAQFEEIFFAVVSAYLFYLILRNKQNALRFVLGGCVYLVGFGLIFYYQRYFGEFFSGDPNLSSFMARYEKIGGDGLGIAHTLLTAPHKVVLQFLSLEKIRVWSLALLFFGPFPLYAFKDSENRLLAVSVLMGLFPYFLKVGLADSDFTVHTGRHYIAEFGPQWWFLGLLGLSFLLHRKSQSEVKTPTFMQAILRRPRLSSATFVILVLFNMCIWQQSAFRNLTSSPL